MFKSFYYVFLSCAIALAPGMTFAQNCANCSVSYGQSRYSNVKYSAPRANFFRSKSYGSSGASTTYTVRRGLFGRNYRVSKGTSYGSSGATASYGSSGATASYGSSGATASYGSSGATNSYGSHGGVPSYRIQNKTQEVEQKPDTVEVFYGKEQENKGVSKTSGFCDCENCTCENCDCGQELGKEEVSIAGLVAPEGVQSIAGIMAPSESIEKETSIASL